MAVGDNPADNPGQLSPGRPELLTNSVERCRGIGRGLLLLNRHEEAIAELKTCALLEPTFRPCHEVAAGVAYAEMGRLDEAQTEAAEAHRLDPRLTLASAPDVLPFKNPHDLQRFLDGLRKAGLPEQ